jgi:hypothetical protein
VFKKALKIAVSFCVLIGAYAGYTRLFAFVTYQLGETRERVEVTQEFESKSSRRAKDLAQESFPKGHWAGGDDLKLQYYEEVHGFYMFAQNKAITPDNKHIHVWPFAMIWISKDGRTRKIATSDEAFIDLSQPLFSGKPSNEPMKVTHAKMVGDVRLRDDKGTREELTDDLRVGPLAAVEFDDKTLQITTERDTEIFLQDRNLTLTGLGMMIQLRRKVGPVGAPPGVGGAAGFDAETAFVYKDVHVVVKNATSDGVLPGKAKPEKNGSTPIDVRSDNELEIILPPPRPQVAIGPPYYNRPPDPTFVKFRTNVQVIRGTDKTEQLNCDTLDLTLLPDPKKPEELEDDDTMTVVASESTPKANGSKSTEEKPAKDEGPLTELKIRVALARGDAVWLQSEAQGMLARCVELKYEKHAFEGKDDITFLNGGTGKKLMVEKADYDSKSPVPGTIKSIMRLTAIDATIFESGGSSGSSKVIARGPGKIEERPARNASVSRTVWFEDEMEMLTWHDGVDPAPTPSLLAVRALSQPREAPARGTLRRLLTLSGVSKLVDHNTSTTLDARKSIVAEFQAERGCDLLLTSPLNDVRDIPTAGKNLVVVSPVNGRLNFRIFDRAGQLFLDTNEVALGSKKPQIDELKKQLEGLDLDHEPTASEKKRVIDIVASIVSASPTAKLPIDMGDGPAQIKWLDAYEDAHLTAPSKTLTARLFLKAKFEQAPVEPKPAAPAPVPGPVVASATPAPVTTEPKPDPEAKPLAAEPLVDGRADRVWASVQLAATGDGAANSKGELKNAQLRGGVMVHQDPAPGKALGSDASGEALDLTTQGKGLMKFVVSRDDPQAFDPKTRRVSSTKGRAISSMPMARVQTEGKTIESENIIGIDQKLDYMWVEGAGVFTQLAERGLLDDKGVESEKPKAGAKAKQVGPNTKDQLVITWNSLMQFYGRSADLKGRPAAKIEFRGNSEDIHTPDGRHEYRRGVEARMTDSAIYADTMDVYMDRIIALNKDARKPAAKSDEPKEPDAQIAMLECFGEDVVENYKLKWAGVDITSQKLYPESGEIKEKQRIQGQHIIYDKRTGDFFAPGPGTTRIYRRKGGDGKAEGPIPTVHPVSSTLANGRSRPEAVLTDKKLPPLELTRIKYTDGMQGRFGVAKDQAEEEPREAQFVGAVQTVNASVPGKNSDIDFDHVERWPDYVFLTSDVLNVFSYPNAPGSKPANRQLLNARGNAVAKSKFDVIQADRVTYNSATSLTYAYGEDDKEVSITKQESPGQRPTTTRGKMVRYNNVTRESDLKDPHAIQITDLKTGLRAKAFMPDLGGSPKPIDPKPLPRPPLQRQGRNSTERKSFTGGN